MKNIFLIFVMILLAAGVAASATEAEMKALETKAQQGDIAAQRDLGGAYIEEGLKLYQKAADRGYAPSQYVMGRMYYGIADAYDDGHFFRNHYGNGKTDLALAKSYYTKAANQKNVDAQNFLGDIALGRDPGPEQIAEAMNWYTMGAEQGDKVAQRELGILYTLLPKEPQNVEASFKWLALAADQGDAWAQYLLAERYYRDNNDKITAWVLIRHAVTNVDVAARFSTDKQANSFRSELESSMTAEEKAEALRLYEAETKANTENTAKGDGVVAKTISMPVGVDELKRKARTNAPEALYDLAEYYAAEGVKCYLKAAAQNDVLAQRALGILYNGESVIPYDGKKSAHWFAKAAENGDMISQRAMGFFESAGHPTFDYDADAALKWLNMAAEQGDVESQYRLAVLYAGGGRVPKDEKLMLKWLTAAAEEGYHKAQYELGMYYANQFNYEDSGRWLERAASGTDFPPDVLYDLGLKFFEGKEGLKQDYAKSFKLFKQAVQMVDDQPNAYSAGSGKYHYMVGLSYYKGYGANVWHSEALRWLNKAADMHNGPAAYQIGQMYKNGHGVGRNVKTAIQWFEKAHEYYDENAAFALGQIYANGEGLPKDEAKALNWFVVSATLGNDDALQWIAANPGTPDLKTILQLQDFFAGSKNAVEKHAITDQLLLDAVAAGNVEAALYVFSRAGATDVKMSYAVAKMFFEGNGLPKDITKAWAWNRLALEKNNPKNPALDTQIQKLMNDINAAMTERDQMEARSEWSTLESFINKK